MSVNPQGILVHKQVLIFVDQLIEEWFDTHDVPLQERMSTPLMLLVDENRESGLVSVFYQIGDLHYQHEGHC